MSYQILTQRQGVELTLTLKKSLVQGRPSKSLGIRLLAEISKGLKINTTRRAPIQILRHQLLLNLRYCFYQGQRGFDDLKIVYIPNFSQFRYEGRGINSLFFPNSKQFTLFMVVQTQFYSSCGFEKNLLCPIFFNNFMI